MSEELIIDKKPLTRRQLQALRYLARGMTPKEAATIMVIDRDTFYRHLRNARIMISRLKPKWMLQN